MHCGLYESRYIKVLQWVIKVIPLANYKGHKESTRRESVCKFGKRTRYELLRTLK